MSEAVVLALIESLPLILTACAALLSAWAAVWKSGQAVKGVEAAKAETQETKHQLEKLTIAVNGNLARVIEAIQQGASAKATAEAALQAATAPTTKSETIIMPERRRSEEKSP